MKGLPMADNNNDRVAELSEDGQTLTGRWQWPGGGFDVVSKKMSE